MTNRQLNLTVALLVGIAIIFLSVICFAQEHQHEHGVNVPDWYDPACCNRRDCFPIEQKDEKDLEFGQFGTEPVIKYLPTGSVFTKDKFRKSKDERFHVCLYRGEDGRYTNYCIYIPMMT